MLSFDLMEATRRALVEALVPVEVLRRLEWILAQQEWSVELEGQPELILEGQEQNEELEGQLELILEGRV